MSSPEFFRTIRFWPRIDSSSCSFCMQCLSACGLEVIHFEEGAFTVKQNTCRNCRSCVKACTSHAITIEAALDGSRSGHLMKQQPKDACDT